MTQTNRILAALLALHVIIGLSYAVLTPLWHGVEWARNWALGVPSSWPWWAHALFLMAVALGCAVGASRTFRKRLIS